MMAILLAIPLMLCGCSCIGDGYSDKLKHIPDGDFLYYYMKDKDSYAISGITKQGKGKDVLYFPAYYKNKLVTDIGYVTVDGIMSVHNLHRVFIEDMAVTKVYVPYTIADSWALHVRSENDTNRQIYFANSDVRYLESAVDATTFPNRAEYYVTPAAHGYILRNIKDHGDIHIANTSYMFNYENAPNGGCFFINNFDTGGLIENTPYAPRRDGYTFDGWYKEPECKNIWKFEIDTLQQAPQDESEGVIYQETKLYAKWIEN